MGQVDLSELRTSETSETTTHGGSALGASESTGANTIAIMSIMIDSPPLGKTDLSRWRLRVSDGGRHVWHYLDTEQEAESWPQTPEDKYWLGLPTVRAWLQDEDLLAESSDVSTCQKCDGGSREWTGVLSPLAVE